MTIMRDSARLAAALALLALASIGTQPALAGPIHDAAKSNDAAQVEQLVAAGADVDEKDAAFNTALHLAADAGHAEVAQVLVGKGANLDA